MISSSIVYTIGTTNNVKIVDVINPPIIACAIGARDSEPAPEAMAAGIPIITTNRGGNAEVVSGIGNGYVIDDYTNPLAFVKYIDYLLKNPDIAMQIGQKGRRLAEERHSWDKVALNVLDAINRVQK